MLRTIAFAICLSFIIQAPAFSDIVQLKDGNIIKGVIVAETEGFIKLKTSIAIFTLPKSDVEKIQRGASEENEELIKQWDERKRRLEEEMKRVQQGLKTKTKVEGTKESSGGGTRGPEGKTTEDKKRKSAKASYEHGIGSINTGNYANRVLQYYYYIPGTILENKNKTYPLLLMIPWLSGRGEDFVTSEFKGFAYKNKFVIISPSFVWDSKNWDSNQSYQYPAAWSGGALLEIIDRFKKEHGIRISKFYIFGFSAGAQFALRFALWKPHLCIACAAHGSGGRIVPERKIDVKFFVTCGSKDVSRIEYAKEFYNSAKSKNIDVTYKEYNTEHSLTNAQIGDSLKFFEKIH